MIDMIRFIVRNRSEIDNGFCPSGKSVLISISDKDGTPPRCSDGYDYRLNLFFDDADDYNANPDVQLINRSDAKQMIDIIYGTVYDGGGTVVLHCNAGVSRSAGAAAALCKIFTGDDNQIVKVKPLYNRKVYRTVLETYFEG